MPAMRNRSGNGGRGTASALRRERRAGQRSPRVEAFSWLIEELRVSLFAQELRTPVPVSFKRVEKAWTELSRTGMTVLEVAYNSPPC